MVFPGSRLILEHESVRYRGMDACTRQGGGQLLLCYYHRLLARPELSLRITYSVRLRFAAEIQQ
jgi:hypothetical protein